GVVLSGAGVVGIHVWSKPHPSADEIRTASRGYERPGQWINRTAPDFELRLLDGTSVKLADHIGKEVVILNFFATWCGPCRQEMPELARFQALHATDGVLLLGIDSREKHAVVEQFVHDLSIEFPIALDEAGDVGKLYDVDAFPTTVVIGADGQVKSYETGAI